MNRVHADLDRPDRERGGDPGTLNRLVAERTASPVDPQVDRLVAAVRERFGDSLDAVLLYGSCLRAEDFTEGLVDLYALVDSYRGAYRKPSYRVANALLPPNVFYLELNDREPHLRSKYTILSLSHFERGCSRWFHSYLWARFAQPCRLVWARDDAAAGRVHEALAAAVRRFLGASAPLLAGATFDAERLWSTGFERSYAAELRPEKGRAAELTEANRRDLRGLTAAVAAEPGSPLEVVAPDRYRCAAQGRAERRARVGWWLRRWQGRGLSVARLIKGAFTFEGGIDYLAWKVQRHTGESVRVTPAMRRHPVLRGLPVLFRLLRRGTVQ